MGSVTFLVIALAIPIYSIDNNLNVIITLSMKVMFNSTL